MKPIFVAYYTTGTPYEREAVSLSVSLSALSIEHCVKGVASLGSWQKNTQYKAHFVKRMLESYGNRPIVYIDVDAIVIRYPALFDTLDCDVAAARFAGQELLSGTVYFGNTKESKRLVDYWIKLNEQWPDRLPDGREAWDQRTLDIAIRDTRVRYTELGPEYTYITELSQRRYPDVTPIILHTRGALRFKKGIDDGSLVCNPDSPT